MAELVDRSTTITGHEARVILGVFGNMPYSGGAHFTWSGLARPVPQVTVDEIVRNLQQLGDELVRVAEQAAADQEALSRHRAMFRALGELASACNLIPGAKS